MDEDVLLALQRDDAFVIDPPALAKRALAEIQRQLEAHNLESGKSARRLLDQLIGIMWERDAVCLEIARVSPEDAVRITMGRLLRFVGWGSGEADSQEIDENDGSAEVT